MHDWTIPAKSFDAATMPTTPFAHGATLDLEQVMTEHACEVVVTGTGSIWATFRLEGSLNGTDWYMIGSGIAADPSAVPVAILISAADAPALFVRASGYGDGTSVATSWHTSG